MNNENNKPKPHPHAQWIKLWADGIPIEYKAGREWVKVIQFNTMTMPDIEYRIKPSNEPWKPKGTTDVNANVGSNVGSIDGKPLSEGEKALIKALRKTWGFAEILKPGDAVVVTKAENGEYISTTHNISFMLIEGDGSNTEVVNALELINEEHKEENRQAIQRMSVIGLTAAKIFQKEAQNEAK